jgi:hypothetical protein
MNGEPDNSPHTSLVVILRNTALVSDWHPNELNMDSITKRLGRSLKFGIGLEHNTYNRNHVHLT